MQLQYHIMLSVRPFKEGVEIVTLDRDRLVGFPIHFDIRFHRLRRTFESKNKIHFAGQRANADFPIVTL